jgi:hypothetical protein
MVTHRTTDEPQIAAEISRKCVYTRCVVEMLNRFQRKQIVGAPKTKQKIWWSANFIKSFFYFLELKYGRTAYGQWDLDKLRGAVKTFT